MAAKKVKSARKLERHFKGVANHRRIEMLLYIASRPDCILEEIAEALNGNTKTISEHTRRLVVAGLVEKSYAGRQVQHRLTPYGHVFVDFIKRFSNISQRES